MTTTTEQHTTTAKPPANPHSIATAITLWAIPIVLIGAIWGASHDPQHAGISAAAALAIVVIHLVKRAQRTIWNLKNRDGQ